MKRARRDQIAFPSTGDPAKDQELLDRYMLHDDRLSRNICPNGCGPMTASSPHDRDCPKCGFHFWSNVPIADQSELAGGD